MASKRWLMQFERHLAKRERYNPLPIGWWWLTDREFQLLPLIRRASHAEYQPFVDLMGVTQWLMSPKLLRSGLKRLEQLDGDARQLTVKLISEFRCTNAPQVRRKRTPQPKKGKA